MKKQIKRIYLGLPNKFVRTVLWVEKKFRRNPLSFIEGGTDVVVEYHSGQVFGYDKIKMPSTYIMAILNEDLQNDYIDFNILSDNEKLGIIKQKIHRIFSRIYDESTYEIVPFKEIWNSSDTDILPWERLKEFDRKQIEIVCESEYQYLSYHKAYSPYSWWNNLENGWRKIFNNNMAFIPPDLPISYIIDVLNLDTLLIDYNDLDDITSMEPFKELKKLEYLQIINNGAKVLIDNNFEFLKYLNNLLLLSVQICETEDFSIKDLRNCTNLKGLSIRWSTFRDWDTIFSLKELKYLDLFKSCCLDGNLNSERIIGGILGLPKLKSLCLCDTNVLQISKIFKECPDDFKEYFTHGYNDLTWNQDMDKLKVYIKAI